MIKGKRNILELHFESGNFNCDPLHRKQRGTLEAGNYYGTN